MKTIGYETFKVEIKDGQAWVTFDYPPVNIQGIPMLNDLNALAEELENDRSIKVVVFQSANPDIFVAHADTNFLKEMSTVVVSREEVELLYLQKVLQRISELPQATIAKIEGYARGGGSEFAQALDMRFAVRGKAKFMQMEVGMGILPCGGGASRLARLTGLGKALEITLSARDIDADQAANYGLVNRAFEADEIGPFVQELAERISKFPSASIEATKRAVHASIDLPIHEALKEEAYQLYQATSQTPAIKRFAYADENGAQFDMNNQHNWNDLVVGIQDVK
ncbi:enoyl-CoA hydratase/isomerase family protein [Marinifilum caeruleilacunae]|uniref:Enoyl-CoA hydratase/isomerase family protein n=1 Tax=Marinifilum caeruleilacunae TaxID=2499076 RepID=A0ABX1WW86_9BACT|nr:enoyl-CoA hydratase/isomerase family protein [Marinifilum caeruleilacunae]NOU60158.1 enoyl-CoA hydratase/isomerase family protein [Marinifilum caeruleilacunae]